MLCSVTQMGASTSVASVACLALGWSGATNVNASLLIQNLTCRHIDTFASLL